MTESTNFATDTAAQLDQAIQTIERLYTRITGHGMNPASQNYSPVTSEIDFTRLLDLRMQQLNGCMQDPVVQQMLAPWTPAVALWESEERILVRIFLAGVRKEDVDISIRGNFLFVTGVRHNTLKEHGFQPRLIEGERGHFQRMIALPHEITAPEISSTMADGVLEVFIPKSVVAPVNNTTAMKRGKNSGAN